MPTEEPNLRLKLLLFLFLFGSVAVLADLKTVQDQNVPSHILAMRDGASLFAQEIGYKGRTYLLCSGSADNCRFFAHNPPLTPSAAPTERAIKSENEAWDAIVMESCEETPQWCYVMELKIQPKPIVSERALLINDKAIVDIPICPDTHQARLEMHKTVFDDSDEIAEGYYSINVAHVTEKHWKIDVRIYSDVLPPRKDLRALVVSRCEILSDEEGVQY
jgi:hypothetical protein